MHFIFFFPACRANRSMKYSTSIGYVFFPCPQRRDLDRKDIEAVSAIHFKSASVDRRLQVAIGGGNHSNIGSNCLVSANALEFTLLETRSSAICVSAGSSPISSRKIVPPSATSNLPRRCCNAPVNAPFSWPNNSRQSNLAEWQHNSHSRRAPNSAREWRCMARATSSFARSLSRR